MIINFCLLAGIFFGAVLFSVCREKLEAKTIMAGYYSELFEDSYICLSADTEQPIEIPVYDIFAAEIEGEKSRYPFLKAVDIGVCRNGKVEHPAEGWTLTCIPDGIVRCKISSDGKKLLMAGYKEGHAEVHISYSESLFKRILTVEAIDWKTFCYRAGLSDGENPYGK